MHLSPYRVSKALCISGNGGAFPSMPTGSFPIGSEITEEKRSRDEECQGRQIVSPDTSPEFRENRFPSIASLKRNAKISLARWRCRHSSKKSSCGVITFDDFTADLYGFDVDDELPLLDDIYMHGQDLNLAE
jgi:hypothetical protein